MGDKWKTSVNSCGPRHPEWVTSAGDKWETSVKLHVAQETQSERQVWETRGEKTVNSCNPRNPEWETSVGDKWKTSVNSCGPRHPSVRDKWDK